MTVDTIRQIVVDVEPKEKLDALCDLIRVERPASCIVFRKRKVGVDELVRQLKGRGVEVSALHGGMTQGQRDGVMLKFRSERAKLLVATNVAARGLDISHVTHVISYDVPDDPDEYTHRIGRTGRVGRSGIAYTFAGRRDARVVADIERVTGASIEHIPASALRDGLADQPAARAEQPLAAAAQAPTAVEATVVEETTPRPRSRHPCLPRPPRSSKSGGRRRDPEPAAGSARLFVSGGRRHGIDRDQVIAWFRDNAGPRAGPRQGAPCVRARRRARGRRRRGDREARGRAARRPHRARRALGAPGRAPGRLASRPVYGVGGSSGPPRRP